VQGFQQARLDQQPEAIAAMNDLGMVYLDQKKYQQAEEVLGSVVKTLTNTQGIDHPHTLSAMSNLALAYDSVGKHAEAERAFTDVLKKQREVLGNNHPDTLMSMINLGNFYVYRSEPAKAEQLLLEAMKGCRTALDDQHIMTNAVLAVLSALYAKQGKLEKLGPLLVEARDVTRARWGPDSGLTLGANQAAAAFFLFRKDHARAEPYLHDILAYRIKKEPDSWARFKDESAYGICLLEQKKYAEAAPPLISAYEGMKAREKAAPEQERKCADDVLARIVGLYEAWGKKDVAQAWRKKPPSAQAVMTPRS
jgi:tetratricopeptide (TPR) repeat protein